MTLRFLSFEQNQTPVFSIQIPSTNIDFIQTNSKFEIKVVMESPSFIVLSIHWYCLCIRHYSMHLIFLFHRPHVIIITN